MSWGCANVVRSMVSSGFPAHERIAVLGAGVMGLTAAALLREAGFRVTIYAAKLTGTTSDVAGGQWAPSWVEFNEQIPAEKRRFEDILRFAFRKHQENGPAFGVSPRVNYTVRRSATFAKVPSELVPAPTRLARLPFARLNRPGYAYSTMLVEPPIFLGRLRRDLHADPNVTWVTKLFQAEEEVRGLPEQCVVNCTGLGSKMLFNDPALCPVKGQLALVKAQPQLQYLYSTGETYVFPRSDYVVVGGSYEKCIGDEVADPIKCRAILEMARRVFDGHLLHPSKREDWMMNDK